jgi:hypothetical protein
MIGETFLAGLGEILQTIEIVPNHGHKEYMVYLIFYNGLNAEVQDQT